jgi:hypothetical protein
MEIIFPIFLPLLTDNTLIRFFWFPHYFRDLIAEHKNLYLQVFLIDYSKELLQLLLADILLPLFAYSEGVYICY